MFQSIKTNNFNDKDLEVKLILIRVAACLIYILYVGLTGRIDDARYPYIIISFYLIFNFGLWAYASVKLDSRLFIASIYIDIMMITSLISFRGGIASELYTAYFAVLAYILSKKQKHLIVSATIMIILIYPIACIIHTDMSNISLNEMLVKLGIRIASMLLSVFILLNIKTKMNYSTMLSQKAYEMALIDPLTKVYNRNMLNTLYEYRKSFPYSLSFAMIDIDDFKQINDSYGHLKGDDILSMLGDLIKRNIRSDDICIRYGGEEFLLAFKNTDNETALKILDRIRTAFSEHVFYYQGSPMCCTISVGLAWGHADDDTETIISYADTALYEAKRNGKNNIITYLNAV